MINSNGYQYEVVTIKGLKMGKLKQAADELPQGRNEFPKWVAPIVERYFYLEGQRDMAWDLAVWKDGRPRVGIMEHYYEDFIKDIDREQDSILKTLNATDCDLKRCSGCPDCKSSIVQIPEEE